MTEHSKSVTVKRRIVTLMYGMAWARYGRRFVKSFNRYWPDDVELWIVTDAPLPVDGAVQFPLHEVPGLMFFLDRHRRSARAEGRESGDRKATPGERFWKHDAVKWAPQAMCPVVALDGMADGDILTWFDADCETIRAVPEDWLDGLLGGHDLALVERGTQHPEIGYWSIRVNDKTRSLVRSFAAYYDTDKVFALPEWHSGYVFGRAVQDSGMRRTNLNPTLMRGHPWPITRLAECVIHLKGKLKDG